MARMNIDILGISELQWTGMGELNSDDRYIYYCWQESLRRNGVAIIVNKKSPQCSTWMQSQNDRMISVRFQGKPFIIIQYHSNPSVCSDQKCWRSRSWTVLWRPTRPSRTKTPKDVLFIIGDSYAKVGSQEIPGVTGKFGLRVQNDARQKLTEFSQENTLVIANTFFQQHKRRLYTWTSPDGQPWNQIDYILCSQRWRSYIQSAKTRLEADCGSDHELFVANSDLNWRK